MKKSISLLLLTFFTIIACKKVNDDCNLNAYPTAPSQSWFSSVNGTEEESHGHYILTCSDGGYLQVGETGFIPKSAKILVVKTNSEGSLLWKREFGTKGHNLGNSAIETSDGYLICGAINQNSALIKVNKNDGTPIFQKTYDHGGNDAFEHLTATSTGIIAVGYTNAQDHSSTFYSEGQGSMSFLDLEGIEQNTLSLNNYLAHAYRIQSSNQELIISGLTQDANDYGLIKTDILGNIIWYKTFGGTKADHCFGMDIDDIGNIFLTGHTLSGTENWDTYTMKIDMNGNQVWETKVGNPRGFKPKYIHDEAWDVKNTNDGGCIIVAGTGDEYNQYKRKCGDDDNSSIWHVYLIKLNSVGTIEWQRTYGGNGDDWAGEAIDLTSDGAIIAVDNGEFGFLKINSL